MNEELRIKKNQNSERRRGEERGIKNEEVGGGEASALK